MAATPYRCTVTVGGTKFNAVCSSVKFSTESDSSGMPQMGSLKTSIRVYADFHDDQNLPHAALKKIFDLANVVTRDKIVPIKIEHWKDDSHQDALCSYSFNGWIRRFETSNPHPTADFERAGDEDHPDPPPDLNHMLALDLEPALNQQNFSAIQLSN